MSSLRKYQLSINGIFGVYFYRPSNFYGFNPQYVTSCLMKLAYFMLLSMGLNLYSVIAAQAAMPLWSFTPDRNFPPGTAVSATGIVMVKYIVTNNTSHARNLAIRPQTGVNQNDGPCSVGPHGSCTLLLTIVGSALPARGLSGGPILCQTLSDGKTAGSFSCYQPSPTDNLAISLISHHLSMLPIPLQNATANQPFVYNLKSAVQFYDENAKAGFPAQGLVTPDEQDGLHFDPASFSIVGVPKRIGTYLFKVGVKNAYSTVEPVDFTVQVNPNAKDKPVFKQHYFMNNAISGQKYTMNLIELVEPTAGFMLNNQLSFRIDSQLSSSDWLSISSDDPGRLEGNVPVTLAGQEAEITLIASSNTGGDSLPLTVKIPIMYDSEKKPVINPFRLEHLAGTHVYDDLSGYINDPAHDSDLKLILEKVEPAATWLSVSSNNPTVLQGIIPDKVAGQQFQLTLRAHSSMGGNSDSIIVPFQISIDTEQAPRFKEVKPLMPMLYPEQPFFYDFVASEDIYPEYSDVPYEIKFAPGFNPPDWLRMENNKLIADRVPEDVKDDIDIYVVIKNIPGGFSRKYLLRLIVMI